MRRIRLGAATMVDMVLAASPDKGETVMKTMESIVIALSVLAGVASSTNALDTQKFWQDHVTSGERQRTRAGSRFLPHGLSLSWRAGREPESALFLPK
jgi:hypothetical protein